MALKTSPHLSKGLASLALLAILLAACGSSDADPLSQWTCTRGDIPADYQFRTGGNANSDSIGLLNSSPADAVTDTYFTYWKQTVGDPPFEMPGEILCQVTRFVDEETARAYVATLSADTRLRGLPTFAWLPDGYTVAERSFIAPRSARVFEVLANGELRTIAAVQIVDRYVQTILQGTSTGSPTADIAVDIAQALRTRTKPLQALADE